MRGRILMMQLMHSTKSSLHLEKKKRGSPVESLFFIS